MMKVVQTVIDEVEYQLLKRLGEEKGKPIKVLVREAISSYLRGEERVERIDPLFSPPASKEGVEDGSLRHDEYIYGEGD